MTDTPSSGRFDGKDHLLPARVYYEDTDFTGLVYHANYLRFFERGRSDFLRLAGVDHSALLDGETPTAFVVRTMNVDFLKAARIDDALVIRTRYRAVKGPRLLIDQVIERGGEALCTAAVTAVCISLDGRARRPGAALVQAITPWLTGEDEAG